MEPKQDVGIGRRTETRQDWSWKAGLWIGLEVSFSLGEVIALIWVQECGNHISFYSVLSKVTALRLNGSQSGGKLQKQGGAVTGEGAEVVVLNELEDKRRWSRYWSSEDFVGY